MYKHYYTLCKTNRERPLSPLSSAAAAPLLCLYIRAADGRDDFRAHSIPRGPPSSIGARGRAHIYTGSNYGCLLFGPCESAPSPALRRGGGIPVFESRGTGGPSYALFSAGLRCPSVRFPRIVLRHKVFFPPPSRSFPDDPVIIHARHARPATKPKRHPSDRSRGLVHYRHFDRDRREKNIASDK